VAGNSIVLVLDSTLVAIKQTPHQMEAVTEQKKKSMMILYIQNHWLQ
jgi:hypothetical protein